MNANEVILACDGGKSRCVGGWGVLLQFPDHREEFKGYEIGATSQQMEMKALLNGLRALKDKSLRVEVISDSAYVINCFNKKWYENWEANGWIAYANMQVKNMETWKELLEEARKFEHIVFTHVRGHRGHPLNERADELATSAVHLGINSL